MEAHGIANGFDVAERAPSSVFQVSGCRVVDPLVLGRSEESFHRGVVVAAAGAAHRTFDAQLSERLLIRLAGVLTAAIRAVQEWCPVGRRDSTGRRRTSHTNSVARDVLRDQPRLCG